MRTIARVVPRTRSAAVGAFADDVATRCIEARCAVGVDPKRGLPVDVVEKRRERYGPNELEAVERPSLLAMVWEAVTEPFVVLLFVAGVLAVLLGETRDGALVLVGLLPIVGADVVTTYRSEKALESLRAAAAPTARVRRDGRTQDILAADLVPGDLLVLEAGAHVPADGRLLRSSRLRTTEAALTGESVPVDKDVNARLAVETSLADRRTMVYLGKLLITVKS